MPLHLPPLSRRRFIAKSLGAATCVTALGRAQAADPTTDPDSFALLADTHVAADPEEVARGVNMSENLKRVGEQLRAMERQPAGVMIDGDCAYLRGLSGDYDQLGRLLQPVRQAGLPLHLTMGNHDDRRKFADVLDGLTPRHRPVESQLVSIVEARRANWFLLDSLMKVNVVTGELGEAQLGWLDRALGQRRDKPAILVGHHDPQFNPGGDRVTGLKDTGRLFELLRNHEHVQAYIYGHTHNWSLRKHQDIHLINLPPVAYVFDDSRPSGWIHARLDDNGMELRLHSLNPEHPEHGQTTRVTWHRA